MILLPTNLLVFQLDNKEQEHVSDVVQTRMMNIS